MKRVLMLGALMMAAGCGGELGEQIIVDTDAEADREGPLIDHAPVTTPQVYGQEILLEATVDDTDSGVFVVDVIYRQETAGDWTVKTMRKVGSGLFQGSISGDDVYSGGMRYYLRATDYSENRSCLPEDCEEEAWHFSVVPPS